MPVATISPSIDIEALTLIGIKAAKTSKDALAVAPGLRRAYEDVLGKTPQRWDTSDRYTADVQVVEHTGVTNFQTGFEEYDESALVVGRPATYGFAISGLAMKIGQRQIRTFQGNALGEWVKRTTGNCMGILHRGYQRRIVQGTGSGFADFMTFNGIDSTTGFFESAAKLSQTNVVGNLSKATYATAPGWNQAVGDLANAFGTNYNVFYAMITSIRAFKDSGKKFGLGSEAFFNNMKRYLSAYERYSGKDEIDGGRVIELFGGIKFYLETYMPIAGASTTTNPISAYVVDAEDVHPLWMPSVRIGETELPDGHFGVGSWRPVSGLQDVFVMPMACAGQMVADLLGSSGIGRRGQTY